MRHVFDFTSWEACAAVMKGLAQEGHVVQMEKTCGNVWSVYSD